MNCLGSPDRMRPGSVLDDTDDSLPQIVSRSGSSVVSHLLAIERHALEARKAHVWAENPLCLVYEEASTPCFKVIRNWHLDRPFVAISWTWQPSCYENPQSGSYWAEHSYPRRRDKLKIRDSILERVTKYLLHKGLKLFWIDQVCIDQDDEDSKKKAMSSMDLIYKNADQTLALLSTPIESSPGGLSRLASDFDREAIERTIVVLERLTEDIWWKRAWIFQEEYIAGIKIDLLFPLNVVHQGSSKYEQIPGEFCIPASYFREAATFLLLAYRNSGWLSHRDSCDRMLGIIGKYQIILRNQFAGSRPMSATIHADIHRRCVQNPWDKLAIAANACDYGIALDHAALFNRHSSISMTLLAQYLLNGEIFVLDGQGESRANDMHMAGAIGWMQITSLKGCKLPTGMDTLSFLKLCRLPNVSFCEEGVRTRGLIWLLDPQHVLCTSSLAGHQMSPALEERLYCEPWAAREIRDLVSVLRCRHRWLADELDGYIQKRSWGVDSMAYSYMDEMMWQLVQAVNRGFPLRIGYTQQNEGTGIFIPARCDVHHDMYAFTAWQSRKFPGNLSNKFVSLRVDARENTVTSALEWMNGLVFFRNNDLQEVTFAWPGSWLSRG